MKFQRLRQRRGLLAAVRAQLVRARIVLVYALLVLLAACANSSPEIVSVTGTVVFDFAAEERAPVTRLAFFMQTDSAVQRADSIEAVHRESGMRWRVAEPRLISGADKQWAGYTNLQPAFGDDILMGAYDCFYCDAAGNEVNSSFTIDYPRELLTATPETAQSCMPVPTTEYVALYTESGELMFFNKRRSSWRENAAIAKDYPDAFTMRRCLVAANDSIVCLLPSETLKAPKKAAIEDADNE